MEKLTILLLAGGDSDRFWPLGDKQSFPFLGKPLSYNHLAQLQKFGFEKIIVVVSQQNKDLFESLKRVFTDLDISLVVQSDNRGMAGAVISARKHIQGRRLIIRNGSDIYEDLLFSSVLNLIKDNPDGIICGIKEKEYFPGGYLSVDKDKVISIVEKPTSDKRPSDIVTIVFDYFKNSDSLLSAIDKQTSSGDDIFEKALDDLVKSNKNFRFLPYKGYWGYLKYPWHVLDVMGYYLQKVKGVRNKNVFIHKSAVISGNVFLDAGVKILENTKILGPVYIGKGTIIGQNCLIRESMVGENCVIGYSTEIARSYIGNNSWFHTNYIGDSIISSNVSLGAGTVFANLKLKENSIKSQVRGKLVDTGKVKLGAVIGSGVRIGINASIMPGVKIGKNSVVGPSVMLDRDVQDSKSCLLSKSNYVVAPNAQTIPENSRSSTLKHLKLS